MNTSFAPAPEFTSKVLTYLPQETVEKLSYQNGQYCDEDEQNQEPKIRTIDLRVCLCDHGKILLFLKDDEKSDQFRVENHDRLRITKFEYMDLCGASAAAGANPKRLTLWCQVPPEILHKLILFETSEKSITLRNLNQNLDFYDDIYDLLPKDVTVVKMYNCDLHKVKGLYKWVRERIKSGQLELIHLDDCLWRFNSAPLFREMINNKNMSVFIRNTRLEQKPDINFLRPVFIDAVTTVPNQRFVCIVPNPWTPEEFRQVCGGIFSGWKFAEEYEEWFPNGLGMHVSSQCVSVHNDGVALYYHEMKMEHEAEQAEAQEALAEQMKKMQSVRTIKKATRSIPRPRASSC